MLDIDSITKNTDIELEFRELPPVLFERISLHLLKDEKTDFCILTRHDNNCKVSVITPFRIIATDFELPYEDKVDKGYSCYSYFNSKIVEISQQQYGVYYKVSISYEGDTHFSHNLYEKEICDKLISAIISIIKL